MRINWPLLMVVFFGIHGHAEAKMASNMGYDPRNWIDRTIPLFTLISLRIPLLVEVAISVIAHVIMRKFTHSPVSRFPNPQSFTSLKVIL